MASARNKVQEGKKPKKKNDLEHKKQYFIQGNRTQVIYI